MEGGGSSPSLLVMQPLTLAFKSAEVEGEFLGEVAKKRWPVLVFIFCFDLLCFAFRLTAKLTAALPGSDGAARPLDVVSEMGHQLANMAMLYVLIALLNKRARKAGDNAARQEEVLLSVCMGLAICNLLASLRSDNAQDYVYLSYFLICTSTFLKIRWWVGTGLLATPTLAVSLWYSSPAPSALLPRDAVVHIVVAWAVGGLMAYLSDWTRRQMYANARLARAAHEKELMEARARIAAQRELAAAQAQAAQRALTVAREKAAHEAKSEFMSLMCHEVRTPLNGCLASAEMLLETPLKEEQRELANTIRVSGSILLSTVSNFLDFFKLEAGKRLDIVRSEVVLSELVGDVHCIIEAMIGRGGPVALQQPQLLSVPEIVCCDPDRLRGVLLNLYTNAAKFTKRGHIVLRVRCVSRDWAPPAPGGFTAIMLQPSYMPSSSADRSMDMSARLIMPALAAQGMPQQQACAAAGDGALDATAGEGRASLLVQQQQHKQPLPTKQEDGQQQQQLHHAQHPKFWQQASQWARRLLPQEERVGVHIEQLPPPQPSSITTSDSSSSLDSLEVAPDTEGLALKAGAAAPDGSSGDEAQQGSGKGGHQIDVHANGSRSAQQAKGKAAGGSAVASSAASNASHPRRNSLATSDDACWLLFEVEDTGVGITRDGLATLFREYVQGTEDEMCKPRTRGGTGLGLSICSKQVAVLGGVIGAYSCRGHGSTFWFKIPVRVGKLHRSPSNASSTGAAAAAAAAAAWRHHEGQQQQQQQQQPQAVQHLQGVLASSNPALLAKCSASQQQEQLQPFTTHRQAQQGDFTQSMLYRPSSADLAAQTAAALAGGSSSKQAAAPIPADRSQQQLSAGLPPPMPAPPPGSQAAAVMAAAAASAAAAAAAASAAVSSGGPRRQLSLDGKAPSVLDTSRLVGRRVLLAEDNLINQTVARKMLTSIGMQVTVAANGAEAVAAVRRTRAAAAPSAPASSGDEQQQGSVDATDDAAAQLQRRLSTSSGGGPGAGGGAPEQPFAIILMDMAMPVMGGVEATRVLRSDGFCLPIVAMTANASDRDRDECASAGMNGFLSKPVLRDQLARAMLAAVEDHDSAGAAGAGGGQ